MRCIAKKICRWYAVLFFISTANAQQSQFLVTQKFDYKTGISPNVRKIIQDSYGFYWLATQEGLNRFDGQRFDIFASGLGNPKKELQAPDVYGIEEDTARKVVYAMTAYGGIDVISTAENRVLKSVPVKHPKDNSSLWLYGLAHCGNYLFAAAHEGGVVARFNKRSESIDQRVIIAQNSDIDFISTDKHCHIWVFIKNYGVRVLDTNLNAVKNIPLTVKLKDHDGSQFSGAVQWEQYMLLSTANGLQAIGLENFTIADPGKIFNNLPSSLRQTPIACISSSKNELMLVADQLVYHYDRSGWQTFLITPKDESGNWSIVNNIFFSNNSILLGTQEGLLWAKNRNSPFIPYTTSQDTTNISIPHATMLYKEGRNMLFVCSTTDLLRLNVNTGNILRLNKPVTDDRHFYFNVSQLDNEDLLVAGQYTPVKLVNRKGIRHSLSAKYPELKPMEKDNLVSSALYNDSLMFFASQERKGIYQWDKKKRKLDSITINSAPLRLISPVINRLFIDSLQRLWIICDNEVSLYDITGKKITSVQVQYPLSHEPTRINMDIAETKDNYWIASYGTGIIKLDKEGNVLKIYSRGEGLQNASLYKIYQVGDSIILVSSNNGISVLNIKTEKIINYSEADGLMSDNFEETSGSQWKNEIYFGGVNGVTLVRPEQLNYQSPKLTLYFTQIEIFSSNKRTDTVNQVKDTFNLLTDHYRIANNYEKVTVHFTALGGIYPDKIKFQYRIIERSLAWSSTDERRFVDLIGLSPGKYHLEIRAIDEKGHISDTRTLILRFLPKWYQTLLFKIAVALLAFGLVYSFYRYRIGQIKKQQKIRKDIASDLHDDIGSTLNSVKIYTHLAQQGSDKDKYIEMAKQNLEQASIGLRDMIWVLDDKMDTADELLTRIKQFALPLAAAMEIETDFKCDFDVQDKVFTKDEKRNLLLICKEAVNNAIKYSRATLISVHFTQAQRKIKLVIEDNGKGFDTGHTQTGNGLKNMEYRAKQIGYRHSITSSSSGTKIMIYQQ